MRKEGIGSKRTERTYRWPDVAYHREGSRETLLQRIKTKGEVDHSRQDKTQVQDEVNNCILSYLVLYVQRPHVDRDDRLRMTLLQKDRAYRSTDDRDAVYLHPPRRRA